jgi:hypothetical protein
MKYLLESSFKPLNPGIGSATHTKASNLFSAVSDSDAIKTARTILDNHKESFFEIDAATSGLFRQELIWKPTSV